MKSEWRVATIPVTDGEFMYGVYRIIDTDKIDHSGNREWLDYFNDKHAAELFAKMCNQERRER